MTFFVAADVRKIRIICRSSWILSWSFLVKWFLVLLGIVSSCFIFEANEMISNQTQTIEDIIQITKKGENEKQ